MTAPGLVRLIGPWTHTLISAKWLQHPHSVLCSPPCHTTHLAAHTHTPHCTHSTLKPFLVHIGTVTVIFIYQMSVYVIACTRVITYKLLRAQNFDGPFKLKESLTTPPPHPHPTPTPTPHLFANHPGIYTHCVYNFISGRRGLQTCTLTTWARSENWNLEH